MSRTESLATNTELVSVIIPLYNHKQYIEECLDSVLTQDVSNIELLLLDDGSSDNGFDIACRWKESHSDRFARIQFEQQANAGITHTFDRLIKKSTGRFIVILASDDVLLPGSISQRLSLFSESKVMAVFADAIPINETGKIMGKSAIGELGKPSSLAALSDPRTLSWELVFRWNVYGSVLICRREALIDPNGSTILNLNIYSEDMQIYYKFASEGSLRYINKPVAKYRIHTTNTSRSPENIKALHKNIYESRKHALNGMPRLRRMFVSLQAFTYHRWDKGFKKLCYLPLIITAFISIKFGCKIYDFIRCSILNQSKK